MATEDNVQPSMKQSVGQQLQRAREKAGLEVGDVAASQHLRSSVIQAIEAGDYSEIDSELFLKGYVRAYANQVGLNADAVIADLDQELEPIRQQREQEQEANPLVDIERRRRRKRQFAKFLFFLIVLGFAGYLVVTFIVPQGSVVEVPSESAPADVEPEPEPAPEPEPSQQTEPEQTSVDDSSERPEIAPPNTELVASAEEPDLALGRSEGLAPEQTESMAGMSETESLVPETPSVSTVDTDDSQAPASEQIPAVVQTPEPVFDNPSGLAEVADIGRLQIRFNDDCWVQVSDGKGNRLVNSMKRDGEQVDVSGPAPLRVVIGAVDAVETIRFQGEPIEMSGFQVVNNRSEFTLTL